MRAGAECKKWREHRQPSREKVHRVKDKIGAAPGGRKNEPGEGEAPIESEIEWKYFVRVKRLE